jgi:hypothetical protein
MASSRWRRRDKLEEFDEMEDDDDDDDEYHDDDIDDEEETVHVEDDEQLDDILDNDLSWSERFFKFRGQTHTSANVIKKLRP